MHIYRYLSIIIIVILISCQSPTNNTFPNSDDILSNNYTITILNDTELPYYSEGSSLTEPLLLADSSDSDGILMFYFKGHKYYHPVQLAQRILLFVKSFISNGDSIFIIEADRYINKLFEIGHHYGDAIYFPYTFDIYPHGGKGDNNTIMLRDPWFSGMAQGVVLSALVRMYKVTGNLKYLDYASLVFRSFLKLKGKHYPWIVYIDAYRNYWIEEYPMAEPTNVLNGFIFAIYGLYDYYLLDPDDEIRLFLLSAAITTIEVNIHKWRRPGQASVYCLKHNHVDETYHNIHCRQLYMLYRICASVYLKEMSTLFAEDTNKP